MNNFPDCNIDPVFTHGKAACVTCPDCGRTTQSYSYEYMAKEAWDNGETKSREELKKILLGKDPEHEAPKKQSKTRYYIPPEATMNFTNNNAPPPEIEYEKLGKFY